MSRHSRRQSSAVITVLLQLLLHSCLPRLMSARSVAVCSDPGCMLVDAEQSKRLPSLGVRITTSRDVDVQEAVLFPGQYSQDTPFLMDGKDNVLEPFLNGEAVQVQKAQGFELLQDGDGIRVFLDNEASLLVFGSDSYRQSESNSASQSLQSWVLRSGVTAVVDVNGHSDLEQLQLWDGLPSVEHLGLGDVSLSLSDLVRADDAENSDTLCPRGEYRDTDENTCRPCDPSCATCWHAGEGRCLSCALDMKLHRGRCIPNRCLGDTYQLNGLGVCIESLFSMEQAEKQNAKESQKSGLATWVIVGPAVGGGVLLLLILAAILYRRRAQQSRELARLGLLGWSEQQKDVSERSSHPGLRSSQEPNMSHQPGALYGQPIPLEQDAPLYEMQAYSSPERSVKSRTSYGPSEYTAGYSVPPFSEGGLTADDDWSAVEGDLQHRIDQELARKRLEVKAVAALEARRSAEQRRAAHLRAADRGRHTPSSEGFDAASAAHERESATSFTPRSFRQSLGSMPARPSHPPPVKTRGASGHGKNPSIEKIETWRRRDTQPDPVPPAETIVTSQPLRASTPQSPFLQSPSNKRDRVEEWVNTPEESPTEMRRKGQHSRQNSKESNLSRGSKGRRRSSGELDTLEEQEDGASDVLTSISRNAAKQATLRANKAVTLARRIQSPTETTADQQHQGVLLGSDLLDGTDLMPRSFQ